MLPVFHHSWDLTPAEAVALQKELSQKVRQEPLKFPPRYIAGTDISYDIGSERHHAIVAVLSYPELKLVDYATAEGIVTFPYIPGLLSFREIPVLLQCFAKLQRTPDLIFCDGQGIAHPRRLGIAAHLGVLLNHPTVGVAKSILKGRYSELGEKRGSFASLMDREEVIGEAVRTKDKVAPVYVSIGNRITLPEARESVLKCVTKYRIPEPTRMAHLLANKARRNELQMELL